MNRVLYRVLKKLAGQSADAGKKEPSSVTPGAWVLPHLIEFAHQKSVSQKFPDVSIR